MKTRIIVAAIFVPLLFVVLFFLPAVYLTVLFSLIGILASGELLKTAEAATRKRLYAYPAVTATAIPFGVYFGLGEKVFQAALILLTAALFIEGIIAYGKEKRIQFGDILTVLFAGCIIPYFLSVMVGLKLMENGRYYVLLPILVTMISDSGAYFAGVYLGKHKAFPHVSPNKTWEGCAGGMLSAIIGLLLYGLILMLCKVPVSFPALLLIAVLGNLATQLGDLAFSLIKRLYGVKDYGKLIPGHGGMLDRFDSLSFTAPVVYLLVLLFPVF